MKTCENIFSGCDLSVGFSLVFGWGWVFFPSLCLLFLIPEADRVRGLAAFFFAFWVFCHAVCFLLSSFTLKLWFWDVLRSCSKVLTVSWKAYLSYCIFCECSARRLETWQVLCDLLQTFHLAVLRESPAIMSNQQQKALTQSFKCLFVVFKRWLFVKYLVCSGQSGTARGPASVSFVTNVLHLLRPSTACLSHKSIF